MGTVRRFERRPSARPIRIPVPVIVAALGILFVVVYLNIPVPVPETPVVAARPGVTVSERFDHCFKGQGFNCIIDGDTFHYRGQSIRVADINTPETYRSDCASEKALGERATRRMQGLLNAGPFQIVPYERDTDKYGRKLRIIMRDGQSLGMILVAEGLAEAWKGYRSSWCG